LNQNGNQKISACRVVFKAGLFVVSKPGQF
jgi:hypothetical protein